MKFFFPIDPASISAKPSNPDLAVRDTRAYFGTSETLRYVINPPNGRASLRHAPAHCPAQCTPPQETVLDGMFAVHVVRR